MEKERGHTELSVAATVRCDPGTLLESCHAISDLNL